MPHIEAILEGMDLTANEEGRVTLTEMQLQKIEDYLTQSPNNNYYFQGAIFQNCVLNGIVNRGIPKGMYTEKRTTSREKTGDGARATDDEALIVKLTPICKKNREKAWEFLLLIRGERAARITELVNEWVKDGLIEKDDAHRNLWLVLHKAGIYDKSESSWNQQVR